MPRTIEDNGHPLSYLLSDHNLEKSKEIGEPWPFELNGERNYRRFVLVLQTCETLKALQPLRDPSTLRVRRPRAFRRSIPQFREEVWEDIESGDRQSLEPLGHTRSEWLITKWAQFIDRDT